MNCVKIFKAMNVGQAIRKIRDDKGIKQKFIADKAGISNEYLSNIESGVKIPTLSSLSKICEALEITVPYLLLMAVEDNIEESVPQDKIDDLKAIFKTARPIL